MNRVVQDRLQRKKERKKDSSNGELDWWAVALMQPFSSVCRSGMTHYSVVTQRIKGHSHCLGKYLSLLFPFLIEKEMKHFSLRVTMCCRHCIEDKCTSHVGIESLHRLHCVHTVTVSDLTSTVSAWNRTNNGSGPIQILNSGTSENSLVNSIIWRKKSTNIETYIRIEVVSFNSKLLHHLSSTVPPGTFTVSLLSQSVGCSLTSCVVFEHQRISDEGIRSFHPWNRLHLEPFVQVTAEQLEGDVGQGSDEDAHCKERQRVSSKQNCHLFCCVHAECVWYECVWYEGVCVCWSSSVAGVVLQCLQYKGATILLCLCSSFSLLLIHRQPTGSRGAGVFIIIYCSWECYKMHQREGTATTREIDQQENTYIEKNSHWPADVMHRLYNMV